MRRRALLGGIAAGVTGTLLACVPTDAADPTGPPIPSGAADDATGSAPENGPDNGPDNGDTSHALVGPFDRGPCPTQDDVGDGWRPSCDPWPPTGIDFEDEGLGHSPELRQFNRTVSRLSDLYLETGDEEFAVCAAAWLDVWSGYPEVFAPDLPDVGTFVPEYSQAYHRSLSGVAGALGILRLRSAASVASDALSGMQSLAQAILRGNIAFVDLRQGRDALAHNQAMWGLLAVAASAVAAGDRDGFAWSIDKAGQVLALLTPEGFIPKEMARNEFALQYHNYTLEPLVHWAELARLNGTDPYRLGGGALRRLADNTITGFTDPELFARRAGTEQDTRFLDSPPHLSWLVLYRRHTGASFGDPWIPPPIPQPVTGNPYNWIDRDCAA